MTTEKPTKKPEDAVRVNVPLPAALHRRLKIRSAEEGIDLKDLIPRLLQQAMGEG